MSIHKEYYVVNDMNKNGESRHLDFWGTSSETSKIRRIQEELRKNSESKSYEI